MLSLTNPYQPSIRHAIYKQLPQDFVVNEQLNVAFAQHGEHLWLHLQKTNLNTAYLVKLLAKWANISEKDVGFSGLKDRHAVTSQWFSLRLPKKIAPTQPLNDFFAEQLSTDEKVAVLDLVWHDKKLSRGTHHSNQFIITLKQVHADKIALENQLLLIKKQGFPRFSQLFWRTAFWKRTTKFRKI